MILQGSHVFELEITKGAGFPSENMSFCVRIQIELVVTELQTNRTLEGGTVEWGLVEMSGGVVWQSVGVHVVLRYVLLHVPECPRLGFAEDTVELLDRSVDQNVSIQRLLSLHGYVAKSTNVLNVDSRLSKSEGIVSMHLNVKFETPEFPILLITQRACPLFIRLITVNSPVFLNMVGDGKQKEADLAREYDFCFWRDPWRRWFVHPDNIDSPRRGVSVV